MPRRSRDLNQLSFRSTGRAEEDKRKKPGFPLREASGSLSIDLNLDQEPRKLLSSETLVRPMASN